MLVEVKRINKEEITVVSSLDVAETFDKRHADILRDIEVLNCSKEFRERNFALSKYSVENNKRNYPMYYITRDGFTLLIMGYTGEKAMRFKEAYIRQFNEMEKALIGKMKEREKGIAVRQALTSALQQSQENARMHGHAYSTYTNCIYKSIFGKNAKQLREQYGIESKDNLRDCFSEEELKAVQSAEMLVSGLVDYGWGYDQIKDFLTGNKPKQLTA
jgi:Rha family phage regulatory protein|uniref:Regulatory protein n=1 Tax=Siphoviridae sp. ctWDo30 TaxID=2826360 RepID=A0A8S5N524_9CAUD|nr:MAG TPA: regulatory protein [Siphoviridae sp. ctWDo30]